MTSSNVVEQAIQRLQQQQGEFYLSAVQQAVATEAERQVQLRHVLDRKECKRLEKKFAKERKRERELLRQIQKDHEITLATRTQEWRSQGVPETTARLMMTERSDRMDTKRSVDPMDRKTSRKDHKLSEERLKQLSKARIRVKPDERAAEAHGLSRKQPETTAQVDVYKTRFKKENQIRLSRAEAPGLTAEALQKMSDVQLLQEKKSLLYQLHGLISTQEQHPNVVDDQWTVRSSVSSWHSSNAYNTSSTTYR